MRRRETITLIGGAAVMPVVFWPRAATAQPGKTVRIGILNLANPEPLGSLLREALRDLGYREGQNLQFEFRSAKEDSALLPGLAAELVGLKVDVVVAYPSPAVAAVKQATREIPIVMLAAGDPVATGLVVSLARPGGNITGTSSTTAEIGSKTLQVISTSYRRCGASRCWRTPPIRSRSHFWNRSGLADKPCASTLRP